MGKNIGNLDRRIILHKKVVTKNDYGEEVITWNELATIWGDMIPLRGFENYEAGKLTATTNITWRVRYRNDLNQAERIIYDGNVYEIISIIETTRRKYFEIQTELKY